ncbi:MAG TPA: hypothetical protein VN256_03825, partial [Pyrinomonadaceae bacterium]|nr:hypothetical protein [Pyrinomonadaceae bacterium]
MRETGDGRSDLKEVQGTEPRVEYERRRAARLAAAEREMQRFRKVGLVRIGLLALGLALVWLAYSG